MDSIQEMLFALAEEKFGTFQASLIPNIPRRRFLGVRTPALRAMAKELYGTRKAAVFLSSLPHAYHEENQLHAFLLSREKDFASALSLTETFLPYIDNWATCDCLILPCFRKHKQALLPTVERWMADEHPFTVRFGIKQLMDLYMDNGFCDRYPQMAAKVHSEEYYVNMMVAWYFATALAKQYDAVLPYLTERRLPEWIHNKTIQKAIESRRIPEPHKQALRLLRIKSI